MKGIVFLVLKNFVVEHHDLAYWEKLIEQTDPKSGAAYTAVGTYEDEEVVNYVVQYSTNEGIEPNAVLNAFGQYMFPALANKYPIFMDDHTSIKTFLKTVHDIIHVEVEKLYPNASLPDIDCDEQNNKMILIYNSPRKLCGLAEGLIIGSAKHFNEEVDIKQTTCMHNGDEHCTLEVTIK